MRNDGAESPQTQTYRSPDPDHPVGLVRNAHPARGDVYRFLYLDDTFMQVLAADDETILYRFLRVESTEISEPCIHHRVDHDRITGCYERVGSQTIPPTRYR